MNVVGDYTCDQLLILSISCNLPAVVNEQDCICFKKILFESLSNASLLSSIIVQSVRPRNRSS